MRTGLLSLRARLTLGYALVFALTVLLGGLGAYLATARVLMSSLDAGLRETASVAQGSIEQDGPRRFFAPELRPAGELSIRLQDAHGTVLARLGPAVVEPAPPVVGGPRTLGGERVLTQVLPGGLVLWVSRPTDTLDDLLETLARALLISALGMIGVACAAGYTLAHRALRPMDAVARTAQHIAEQGEYARRVPPAPGHDELARLTSTVNRMLDRLAATIEREQGFARTAAHELRTPLTALRGRLDLTLKRERSPAEYQRALTSMRERVAALERLTEGLLELARSDAPLRLERVELGALALKVSEDLEDAAYQQGKHLQVVVHESWVQAEGALVERALCNLLDNALKYGEGRTVGVGVRDGVLTVTNEGKGPPAAHWAQLLQPFERGPGVQEVNGSGLGLALVAAVARRWHARLVPIWTGTQFSVTLVFPAAAQGRASLEPDP